MSGIVVDASVALAWCFPDEATVYAEAVLVALQGREMIVPAIWPMEVANALLVGKRRGRIRQTDIRRFADLLSDLPVVEDVQRFPEAVERILPIAEKFRISAYDAAYAEVAVRHAAVLATLDEALEKAGRELGVEIFAP